MTAPAQATKPPHRRTWTPAIIILFGILAVYGQSITFAFVNWDDTRYVFGNAVLLYPQKFTWWDRWFPPYFGYPLPLTLFSYRIDQWLSGVPQPSQTNLALGASYHTTNLFVSILIVGLLYRWCLHYVRSRWATFGGVALFAFHPTTAESIAWVTARKELLLALFSIAALLSLRSLGKQPRWRTAFAILLGSVAALLSKPNAVFLLPFGLWYVLIYAAPSLETSQRKTLYKQSLFVASLLSLLSGFSVYLGMIWQSKLGAVETSRPLFEILQRAVWAFGYHLKLFFYPIGLRIKYIVEPNGFDGYHVLGIAGALALLTLLLHPKTRRSPLGLGAALFATAYLPVSNLMPLRRFIADTYLFLPMIGVALIVALGLQALGESLQGKSTLLRAIVPLGLTLGLLGMMTLTRKQVGTWKDSVTLWKNVARYHSNSPQVCRMLANAYNRTKQLDKATKTYHRCIKKFGPAMYRNNLAFTYLLQGNWRKAKRQFQLLLQEQPNHRRARYYLQVIRHRFEKPTPPNQRETKSLKAPSPQRNAKP